MCDFQTAEGVPQAQGDNNIISLVDDIRRSNIRDTFTVRGESARLIKQCKKLVGQGTEQPR